MRKDLIKALLAVEGKPLRELPADDVGDIVAQITEDEKENAIKGVAAFNSSI